MANLSGKQLQEYLNKYFNAGLKVDGVIGSKTKAAIKAVQKQLGVTADGIWGSKTQAAFDGWVSNQNTQASSPAPTQAVDPNANKPYIDMTVDKKGNISYTPLTSAEIQSQVDAEINPTYNTQRQNLTNQYNQLTGAGGKFDLKGQQIQTAYDTGERDIDDTYKNMAEQASKQMLSKNMMRSSFNKNMQDLVGAQKQSAIGTLNATRTADLNALSSDRTAAAMEYNNALASMDTDKAMAALKRKREIEDQEKSKWLGIQQYNTSVK